MTSFLRYKQQLRTVKDADDVESWITVRGNHIPIKKGQSKEEAVKSFLESKGGNSSEKSSNAGGKFEVVGGSGIKHKTFETQAEAEKWAKENVNKINTSLKVINGYKKYKEYEPKKYEKPESSGKTTFYKNVSGKELWSPAWKGSGRKSGYTAVENQLLTEKEMEKHGFNKESSAFKKVELGKKDHHYMFGARFETKKGDK